MKKYLFILITFLATLSIHAQTLDEINDLIERERELLPIKKTIKKPSDTIRWLKKLMETNTVKKMRCMT